MSGRQEHFLRFGGPLLHSAEKREQLATGKSSSRTGGSGAGCLVELLGGHNEDGSTVGILSSGHTNRAGK